MAGNITYLTDILVANTADLLDVGGALGDTLERVTGELELILDVGGGDDLDTSLGSHATHVLLTQEVTVDKILATRKIEHDSFSTRPFATFGGW